MYHALYRKYRPKDFDSVVGQEAVVKTLKNSVVNNSFSHAYMFFGPRGTGKTSVSKIFARSINCLKPNNGCACGVCNNCKDSFSRNCIDIIEIDAASNNGVDEIRELRNKISLVPSNLKYKVYIIDEVHMLSIGAFNALLKTLEEPPEHAIFILATTDYQKVPDTIISRCQCFSFKRLSDSVVQNKLAFVCKEESIEIEDGVLKNISLLSNGGLRDALSLLDMLVSYSEGKITMTDFIEVNGVVSDEQLNFFIKSIFSGDIPAVLNSIFEFENSGKNLIQIFVQILNYIRDLIVGYYLNNCSLDFSVDLLQKLANNLNEKMLEIKKSSNAKVYMEMFFLKFINDFVSTSDCAGSKKVEENSNDVSFSKNDEHKITAKKEISKIDNDEFIESVNEENHKVLVATSEEKESNDFTPLILNISEIIRIRVNNTLAFASKKLLNEEIKKFEKLNEFTFDQEFGYIVCALLDSKIRAVSEDNMIISFEYDSNVKQYLSIIEKVTNIYSKITNSSKKIAIISDAEWEKYKKEYIDNLKKGIKYEFIEEPNEVFEELEKNDIITSSAIDLFGDIVEIE